MYVCVCVNSHLPPYSACVAGAAMKPEDELNTNSGLDGGNQLFTNNLLFTLPQVDLGLKTHDSLLPWDLRSLTFGSSFLSLGVQFIKHVPEFLHIML